MALRNVAEMFAEIFVGAHFVKQQSLNGLASASPATPQQLAGATTNTYKPQSLIGINLPVKAAYQYAEKDDQVTNWKQSMSARDG